MRPPAAMPAVPAGWVILLHGTGHRGIQPGSSFWGGMTGTSLVRHASATLKN